MRGPIIERKNNNGEEEKNIGKEESPCYSFCREGEKGPRFIVYEGEKREEETDQVRGVRERILLFCEKEGMIPTSGGGGRGRKIIVFSLLCDQKRDLPRLTTGAPSGGGGLEQADVIGGKESFHGEERRTPPFS